MDILSFLPIIVLIFAIVSKMNKGAAKINQRPRTPYVPSSFRIQDLETSLQKWLSYESPTPNPRIFEDRKDYRAEEAPWMDDSLETEGTPGIEGTAGIEGTQGIEGISGTEVENLQKSSSAIDPDTSQSEERYYFPDFMERNLADAVIWTQILGKPKARINRPFARNL
ncbi:hypothetical protein [Desulfosporosinus sp. SB140]|uniref:hypothetical protein n=1 Tax=Desulfosporosinus paludis TaxID=3115649 RepID=UPI00388DD468